MIIKRANSISFKGLIMRNIISSGVNNAGRKTLYHRGGGVKKKLRIIDFKKYVCSIPGIIMTVEYDPSRTSLVSLVAYSNGAVSYILSVINVDPGTILTTALNNRNPITFASSSYLSMLKPGIYINSIEIKSGKGSQYARAGGNFAKLVSLTKDNFAILKLKSKNLLRVNSINVATVGALCLPFRDELWNAGTNRRLGIRPHVRGVAMNPIDHPHGGGQGKTSGGRPSVTPWALTTKGRKTKKKISYAKTAVKG